ncbi:MAG: DUF58 domain-containing protein [Methylacidiphilales bacterium]|nr:DUF58 domain-containing protein [Candidatus Methylacidiphilales bacterium]
MKRELFFLRPTLLWVLLGPILGCMWLAAVNYSNNLVYAVLYLVGSLCFVSLFHSWRNLSTLQVEHIRINSAFVGEEVRVEIHLLNPDKHPVQGLFFARVGEETGLSRWPIPLAKQGGGSLRIAAGDSCRLEVFFPAERRGIYRLESLLVRSSYPFGLVWAAFRVPVDVVYFIYPQPKGSLAWPELRPSGDEGVPVSSRPGDDFAGVRAYTPGQSLRHVDWKAYARGRPLSVKYFTGGEGRQLWLDASQMLRLPLEDRLSQLALWIVNAEKEEISYALRLGRSVLPLGIGPAQSRRALEALAVAGLGTEEKQG